MENQKRGKFIIINNKTFRPETHMGERSGTDKDAAALYEIFLKFGFEVSLHRDCTKDQMLKIMIEGMDVFMWIVEANCDLW